MPSTTLNGFTHHWTDEGQGEPLIMFHGASQSGVVLAPFARELARTLAIDVADFELARLAASQASAIQR